MQLKNLLILLFLCCLACNTEGEEKSKSVDRGSGAEITFDKIKWATKDDIHYPYRDKMLTDLMTNYELHGVKKDSLVNLLGSPDRIDSSYLFYRIAQESLGFFPLHMTTLVIKLREDSTVQWLKIHE